MDREILVDVGEIFNEDQPKIEDSNPLEELNLIFGHFVEI